MSQYQNNDLLQATHALRFIQLQLLELAKDCEHTVQNGLVSSHYFMELQNKLEKLLHETRAAYSPPPRIPDSSDFNTIKVVGRGGFGKVNLVKHTETGQAFAMKVIKKQSLTKKERIQQVLVERDVLTVTDSPLVVSMFCTFETKTELCMVMEYVGGGDCGELLQHCRRLPVNMARFYAAETALAVEYIHSYGILHRDLKPSNLLISSSGHIKLTDFGLSKIGIVNMTSNVNKGCINKIIREFTDKEISGTPAYMAPEVYLRLGYGKPIDWWAVGIILYEFLVGSTPFSAQSVEDIRHKVIKNQIIWPQGGDAMPADAQDLITLLLKTSCVRRLGTCGASEVKAHPFFEDLDWDNLLNQDPVFVPPPQNEDDSSDSDTASHSPSELGDKQSGGSNGSSYDDVSAEDDEESSVKGSVSLSSAFNLRKPNEDDDGTEDEALETSDDDEEPHLELAYFCSVAFRFRKVYGSSGTLTPNTLLTQNLQSTKTRLRTGEEEEDDKQGQEEEEKQNKKQGQEEEKQEEEQGQEEEEQEEEEEEQDKEQGQDEEEEADEGYEEADSRDLYDEEGDMGLLTSNNLTEHSQATKRRRMRRKRGKKRRSGKRRGKKRRRCKGRRRRKERRRRQKRSWRRRKRRQRGQTRM